jgi:hypothetical protein
MHTYIHTYIQTERQTYSILKTAFRIQGLKARKSVIVFTLKRLTITILYDTYYVHEKIK